MTQDSAPAPERPSLYDRLGGIYNINIATVVDDFIDRIMTDPWLNANPCVNEAHHPGATHDRTTILGCRNPFTLTVSSPQLQEEHSE